MLIDSQRPLWLETLQLTEVITNTADEAQLHLQQDSRYAMFEDLIRFRIQYIGGSKPPSDIA